MKKISIWVVLVVLAIIALILYFWSGSSLPTSENNEAYTAASKTSVPGPTIVAPEITSVTQSSAGMQIVWTDPNSKESGYIVFRGVGDNYLLQTQLVKLGANVTSYTDKDIVPGTVYSYAVRPYVTNGKGFTLYPSSNLVVVTAN
jgi:hypothetical protein